MGGVRLGAITIRLDAATVNADIKEMLSNRAHETITHNPDLRKAIGMIFIEQATPYVPMKTGHLRETAFAEGDGRVNWPAHYAMKQYTTEYAHYTTAGTGPNWDENVDHEALMAAARPLIIQAFTANGEFRGGAVAKARIKGSTRKSKRSIKRKDALDKKARNGNKKKRK